MGNFSNTPKIFFVLGFIIMIVEKDNPKNVIMILSIIITLLWEHLGSEYEYLRIY